MGIGETDLFAEKRENLGLIKMEVAFCFHAFPISAYCMITVLFCSVILYWCGKESQTAFDVKGPLLANHDLNVAVQSATSSNPPGFESDY